MTDYILKRVIGMRLNLVLVSMFIFFLLRLVPGDPSAAVLGTEALRSNSRNSGKSTG